VILGAYGAAQSPIAAPPMTYLAVSLKGGQSWSYQPEKGHTVAWTAVFDGTLQASARISSAEIAIFEPSEESIDFVAEQDTRFVLGSAAPHAHDLVLGDYSVHTSERALREGDAEIRRIGQSLRAQGKQSYALREYGDLAMVRAGETTQVEIKL
jgi:redox-sensitive bicupin YhaK (pirin superfamily)